MPIWHRLTPEKPLHQPKAAAVYRIRGRGRDSRCRKLTVKRTDIRKSFGFVIRTILRRWKMVGDERLELPTSSV